MADNTIAQAYVQLMPSMEGVSGQLSSLFGGEVNKAAKQAEGGFSVIKGALANLASQGIDAAVRGIKNLASEAVDTGKTFEASMSQVMATMGNLDGGDAAQLQDTLDGIARAAQSIGVEIDTTASVTDQAKEVLTAFARQMGADTAFSASQAAEALNYMALAGYDVEKSVNMLPTVLNLAAAGALELGEASDMVTDAQSALGLSMDETAAMVDQMAAASSKSNTSVGQLGDAFLKIGATARNLSGGTQELATMLGVLADNGIKGAEGGTHLRNILLSLQSAADDGVVNFGDFSVAVYDAEGNMRSMVDIVADMQNGMDGMTQASKDAIVSGVFNKTDLASINALLGTSSERFAELGDAIQYSGDAAQRMADTQLDNLEGKLTIMQSAWEEFQLVLYESVQGPMSEIVEMVTNELIPGLTDLVNGVDGAGEEIGEAVGGIIDKIIETVSELLPELLSMMVTLAQSLITSIAEHLPDIVGAIVEVIPQILTSLMELLPDLIGGVLDMIIAIINGIAEMLPDIVQAVVDVIPMIIDELMEHLPEMLDAAITLLMAIVDAIPVIIQGLLENLPHIIETIITGLLDAMPQLIEAAITLLMALVEAIPAIISALVEHLPEIISTIITTLLDHLPELLEGAVQLLMAIIDAIPIIIETLIVELPNIITAIVEALLDHLPELVMGAVQLFMGLIEAIPMIIVELVKNLPQIIKAIVKGLAQGFSQIVEVGGQLLSGLWEGISQGISWLWDNISSWASSVIDGIKGIFGIHSPSKVFAEFGEMLSAGLGEGIEDGSHYAIDAVGNMSDDIMDAMNATDLSVDMSASVKAATDSSAYWSNIRKSYESQAEASSHTMAGSVVINVYGAEGQDVRTLADLVADRIQHEVDRKVAIYA